MNSPDNGHDPHTAVTAVHATPAVPTQCDECNAPVEEEQRYCVVCGAHRRHVEDPAARYLSELTARSRTRRAATVARPVRTTARGRGLGLAVALALVPVAAAVGVVAERSHDNNDAKLIQALAKEQAAANADSAGTATSSGSASTTGGAATSADAGSARRSGKSKHAKHGSGSQASHHAAESKSSTIPGGTAISANPPSQAQKQAGAQATQKVQKSKGKSYVKSQQKLPSTVVVP